MESPEAARKTPGRARCSGGRDVVEEDQRRAGEHNLERVPVPEQDGHRQQRAEQVGPQVERHRAGTAAGDDVDLGGRDDQRDDADVEQPDPERPLGHRPGRQPAPRPVRLRHAPHGVTVCHSRPQRNPERTAARIPAGAERGPERHAGGTERGPKRNGRILTIASTDAARFASHLMRLGESGTPSLVLCPEPGRVCPNGGHCGRAPWMTSTHGSSPS